MAKSDSCQINLIKVSLQACEYLSKPAGLTMLNRALSVSCDECDNAGLSQLEDQGFF